jgi:hypothetical protein
LVEKKDNLLDIWVIANAEGKRIKVKGEKYKLSANQTVWHPPVIY